MAQSPRALTILTCLLATVLLSACSGGAASPAPTPQRRAVVAAPQTAASPVASPASSGQQSVAKPEMPKVGADTLRLPSDGQQIVVVDSTEGAGVFVRREPGGIALRIWPDGSPMLVTGDDQFADGRVWRPVTTLDGQSGWVAAEYVLTADPAQVSAALASLSDLANATPQPSDARPDSAQARVVAGIATPQANQAAASGPPAASARVPNPNAGTTAQQAVSPATPQPAAPSSVIAPAPAAPAPVAPAPTLPPTATPIKAPAGARSIDVGSTTLSIGGTNNDVGIQIGSRPRDGMKLIAVQVTIANSGDTPFALYRSSLRLALSDRSRLEPLTGGPSPLPYSASVAPGDQVQGWLTFEVPGGTRVDGLIWSPERDVSYALGIQ